MTPAALLRQARHDAGVTQTQLALRLGSSQPVVARLERGDANPRWDTLTRALRELGFGVELVRLSGAEPQLDLGQLRERLAMTPAERLRTFQSSQESLDTLRARARRAP
ncbi:MAG TPA: helix-turn-helix domain-containing protein [Solirubrobacteraceae bacterium]|nr:helix-turn-helix domain-containing protein [Solirubrobacteraceae bacterium]